MHCICYELEISQEKIFAAILRPVKTVKNFSTSKILGYTVISLGPVCIQHLNDW